jgi:iron complex outermembrane receptor protein
LVITKGVELTGGWRFLEHFRLSGSYSFNDSTTDGNVTYQGSGGPVTVATAGKTVVDAPKNIVYANLAYENRGFFANLDVNYMSKRYFTYTNDESVPGHTVADLGVGYRFAGSDLWTKGLEIQGNVYNLFNERYIGAIGTNGFGFSGDNQTLQAGAPITAFVTVRKRF